MKDNGGPAFPQTAESWIGANSVPEGMSLRDYFAVHASDGDMAKFMGQSGGDRAVARYMHADTMLRARDAASERHKEEK